MSDHIKPEQQFFMVNLIGNCDGTTNVSGGDMSEGVFFTEKEAVACMKEQFDCDADLEAVVYRVTPIWRTVRKYKVEPVKARTGLPEGPTDD